LRSPSRRAQKASASQCHQALGSLAGSVLALGQRERPQILAVEIEQIERIEDRVGRRAKRRRRRDRTRAPQHNLTGRSNADDLNLCLSVAALRTRLCQNTTVKNTVNLRSLGPASRPYTVRRSPRCVARQRLPHVGLGQAELPGDLRWFDASLEGSANSVHLARRQMNDDRFDQRFVRGLS
jgi:hypothetical protein